MSRPPSLRPWWLFLAGVTVFAVRVATGDRVHGQSRDPEADLEIALAALEKQVELTKGWIIEFTKTVTSRDHPDDPFQRQTMRHTERRLGNKFRVTDDELDSAKPEHRWNELRTFDGQRQMTLDPVHKSDSIKSSDFRPSRFGENIYRELQDEGTPLPALLRKWERLHAPEWITRQGRRLLSLNLRNPRTTHEHEVLLDPAYGWQPAEFNSLWFNQRGGTKESSDWSESRVTYVSYHKDEGIYVPTKLTSTVDRVQRKGERYRCSEITVEVTSIQINPDLSEETFTVEFPAGTKVYDADRRVKFIAGQPGSEKRIPKATVPTDGTAPPNPAADPWWSDYRLWIALSVVFIAGAIWWAWRERRK